jgi:uncharacterized protein YuzE
MKPMEIEFHEQYDQEADVYYVSFRTGEPSIVSEHDDALLIEIGMFSGIPTGFRILNYTKHKTAANELSRGMKIMFQQMIAAAQSKVASDSLARENRISRFLEKVTA